MEVLSRFLLIMSLLLLSWHWAATMPRSPPLIATPAAVHRRNFTTTPEFNNTDFLVQSIFDPLPSCRDGEIRTGKRCHRIA